MVKVCFDRGDLDRVATRALEIEAIERFDERNRSGALAAERRKRPEPDESGTLVRRDRQAGGIGGRGKSRA